MMTSTLFSAPHQIPVSQRPQFTTHSTSLHGSLPLTKSPTPSSSSSSSKLTITRCSSSSNSATTSVVEDDPSVTSDSEAKEDTINQLPLNGCRACGREDIEQGCNGDGRIQGGIATIPGFGWWPIKAYRPCPGFLASGGRYRRQGQTLDEVAFGRGERAAPVDKIQSSKKKTGPRKLKS